MILSIEKMLAIWSYKKEEINLIILENLTLYLQNNNLGVGIIWWCKFEGVGRMREILPK